jgi:hypothetical protein
MIVFMSDPGLIQMIAWKFNKNPIRVMNLSSLYSGYQSITDLITIVPRINNTQMPHNVFVDSFEFDTNYAYTLLNDPMMFHHLMEIMIPSREGEIVIILVQRDPYRDSVMESLIKLIQQRYGYNSWVINDPTDVEYIKETPFTPWGITTLDKDIMTHDEMYNSGIVNPVTNPEMNVE